MDEPLDLSDNAKAALKSLQQDPRHNTPAAIAYRGPFRAIDQVTEQGMADGLNELLQHGLVEARNGGAHLTPTGQNLPLP